MGLVVNKTVSVLAVPQEFVYWAKNSYPFIVGSAVKLRSGFVPGVSVQFCQGLAGAVRYRHCTDCPSTDCADETNATGVVPHTVVSLGCNVICGFCRTITVTASDVSLEHPFVATTRYDLP